ncbi:alpha/beta fold hydrolase [Spirosoma koreense]
MTATDVYQFHYEGNSIAYRKFGQGSAVLLAFHGFGQTGQAYSCLEKYLGERFTVFAIDLFFHGNSQYAGVRPLAKMDWERLIRTFLETQHVDRFALVGFSLGGRFALATAEGFADRLDQLWLIAPDGITRNVWYELATGSALGRQLFRYVLRHLPILYALGYFLARLGLLNRTILRFIDVSLSTPDQRQRVYQSWTQFRCIRPDLNHISRVLNNSGLTVHLFTGAFDRIVPGAYVLPLVNRLKRYKLTILQTGHNRLIELTAQQLA